MAGILCVIIINYLQRGIQFTMDIFFLAFFHFADLLYLFYLLYIIYKNVLYNYFLSYIYGTVIFFQEAKNKNIIWWVACMFNYFLTGVGWRRTWAGPWRWGTTRTLRPSRSSTRSTGWREWSRRWGSNSTPSTTRSGGSRFKETWTWTQSKVWSKKMLKREMAKLWNINDLFCCKVKLF